jgi:hypothetical protein
MPSLLIVVVRQPVLPSDDHTIGGRPHTSLILIDRRCALA